MRGAFFDKNTGYHLHSTKNQQDEVSKRLEREGHVFVEGVDLSRYKYDFATGELVIDERPQEWEQERSQKETEARQAFTQLKAAVDDPTTDWTNPAVVKAAFTRCVTMFAFVGRKLK